MNGVDAVLEAVGIDRTIQQAMRMVKKGGSVARAVKETEIKGIYGYTTADFMAAIGLISAGEGNLKSVITHVFAR
jgi:threonine dehydrogenase-like Zn-dependent dehydrogenase